MIQNSLWKSLVKNKAGSFLSIQLICQLLKHVIFKIINVMKALNGLALPGAINNLGSSARYSHLLIEELETFTLQEHAKRLLVFFD
ncbi:MAG: hypothetical protein ACXV8I_10030 [Methylobacter sp.]